MCNVWNVIRQEWLLSSTMTVYNTWPLLCILNRFMFTKNESQPPKIAMYTCNTCITTGSFLGNIQYNSKCKLCDIFVNKLVYFTFKSFDFDRTWWRHFRNPSRALKLISTFLLLFYKLKMVCSCFYVLFNFSQRWYSNICVRTRVMVFNATFNNMSTGLVYP